MIIRDAILAVLGTGPMSLTLLHDKCVALGAVSRHSTGKTIAAIGALCDEGLVESSTVGWFRLTEKACGASDAEIAQDGALKGAVVNNARKRGKA